MIFFKSTILIGIISICSYIGFYKAKTYDNRVIELKKFQNALSMMKSKIEFTYEPLKNIFEEISRIIYKDNENIFLKTAKKDKAIYISWTESLDEVRNDLLLEDKEIIKMLGKLLGKTDVRGQVNEILLTENLIQKQIEKAEIEKEKNMKLCRSMGIILGLGICIILI